MLKKEQKTSKSIQEVSTKETSGMKKLVKKVLTDKAARNAAAMSAFVATTSSSGAGWCC